MILSSEKKSRTTQERLRVCSPIRERNSTVCCSAKGFVRRFVVHFGSFPKGGALGTDYRARALSRNETYILLLIHTKEDDDDDNHPLSSSLSKFLSRCQSLHLKRIMILPSSSLVSVRSLPSPSLPRLAAFVPLRPRQSPSSLSVPPLRTFLVFRTRRRFSRNRSVFSA